MLDKDPTPQLNVLSRLKLRSAHRAIPGGIYTHTRDHDDPLIAE
jgi:hypothetical protein